MTESEAIQVLKKHALPSDDDSDLRLGFLGMLRPFQGKLYEENFRELLEAVKSLRKLLESERISREVMADLWAIVHYTRTWALDKDGMLQRNGLFTDEQVQTLEKWIDAISEEVMFALETETKL